MLLVDRGHEGAGQFLAVVGSEVLVIPVGDSSSSWRREGDLRLKEQMVYRIAEVARGVHQQGEQCVLTKR